MSLEAYQTELALSTLYSVKLKGGVQGSEQLRPSVFVDSGSVDVYIYNGATKPINLAAMVLDTTALEGVQPFDIIPNYIAFKQNAGSTAELVVTGLEVDPDGAIA